MSRTTYKVCLLMIMLVSYFILSGRSGGCAETNVQAIKGMKTAIRSARILRIPATPVPIAKQSAKITPTTKRLGCGRVAKTGSALAR